MKKDTNRWLMTQRAAYRRGKLSQDRVDKLNSIGFSWSAGSDDKWNENFKELKNYLAKEGPKRTIAYATQKMGRILRLQPKDAKQKKEQREFELFKQFLQWREENE